MLDDNNMQKILNPRSAGLIPSDTSWNENVDNTNSNQNNTITTIIENIERIVASYGIDAADWSEAISSQYFLLCLAEKLHHKDDDYEKLLNKCLANFRIKYTGELILDNDSLLITPGETTRIIECMKDEDKSDDYYRKKEKTKADNIDGQRMYINFHYGLLLKIVSSEDTETLRAIKHICLDNLLNEESLDPSGGWYPYRVPWITARILISIKSIDYDSYSNKDSVNKTVNKALRSLYDRLYVIAPYWRSGVGNWVSRWESTGLCLEALFVWEEIESKKDRIKRIINYIFSEENKPEWLKKNISFETEELSNDVLASVILASVVVRITKLHFSEIYNKYVNEIIDFFESVIDVILKQNVKAVLQYCTVPQILYYVLSALE